MRLLMAILLMGGMGAGSVVHLATSPDHSAGPSHEQCQSHNHGESRVPDTHSDCPTCITLASAAPPVVTTALATPLAGAESSALPVAAAHDRDHSAPSRARAPPHG